MSALTTSLLVFACVLGGALFGMLLRRFLSERHLSADSKDLVKMSMGLIGTMTALVLGLLIASAKSSFDTQRNGLSQLAANMVFMDRTLAHYGPESKETRERLRASLTDMLQRGWPEDGSQPKQGEAGTEGRYEALYEKLQGLTPKNDSQRLLQAQALKIGTDIAQTRWMLFTQKGSSIPTPFLVVMVCWLTLILASFGLFAPPNAVVYTTLLICALAVSSAVFLILELDRPFEGIIQIPSAPLRAALSRLGE